MKKFLVLVPDVIAIYRVQLYYVDYHGEFRSALRYRILVWIFFSLFRENVVCTCDNALLAAIRYIIVRKCTKLLKHLRGSQLATIFLRDERAASRYDRRWFRGQFAGLDSAD